MGASARRAGLSPTLVMLLYLAGQCASFCTHIPPFGPGNSEGFFPSSCGRILSLPEFQFQDLSPLAFPAGSSEKESVVLEPAFRDFFLDGHWRSNPRPRPKTFKFLGVAGGTIERSCYSPHYVNTERDYERDYQAALPQGRTAAGGCRGDRKRERSFGGLRPRRTTQGRRQHSSQFNSLCQPKTDGSFR